MKSQKRKYLKPKVNKIKLDRDISIQMASKPPGDPFTKETNDSKGFDPFK